MSCQRFLGSYGFIEPTALAYACFVAFKDPHEYLRALGPTPDAYTPNDASVAAILSLGNVFLLIAVAQFLCCHVSNESRIARSYVFLLVLADYGHIWATYKGIGYDLFMSPLAWNDTTAGNIGASAVLNVIRIAYLSGLFGKDNENVGKTDVLKKVK
ncbi:hypothetical protein TWF106_003038 [Orbilia oligospora]|uniref:DUF7704 domain-containing protein n=1 Tax=Orbilia oligospora TaxID=2813651 RepID=A0A7C8Q7Q1_ORBOL|nr:hypothetical protein TWF106_003038 [Orbilia oligospora]